ncbi:MAG TPA: hypothetical protein VH497_10390 [Vicinamibacterales bacterium]
MERACRSLCAWCACLLIVAGIQARLAAAGTTTEDVPVPGGTASLARFLSIDPAPDRGRFMSEITRLVYETGEVRSSSVAFLQSIRQAARNRMPLMAVRSAGPAESVPVPLTADIWGDAIFRRRITNDELILTIIADRAASLLCNGLLQLDDETLEFFANHPGLLTRIYERSSPIFAAFAGSVHVHDNRVVPVGGDDAVALWEAVANEKVTRAERFLSTLFELNDGRVAYLYDTIAQLDASRRAFVLGAWMPAGPARVERFKTLALSSLNGFRDWHTRVVPFGRPSFDFAMAVWRLAVDETGRPAPPATRAFWSRVLNSAESSDESPVDAGWIAENLVSSDVRQRGERIDQFTFAQRIFSSDDGDRAEQQFVLRSFPRFRAMMLTFERAGFTKPSIYASVVRHGLRLQRLDGRNGYVTQASLQGALALVTRMAVAGTFDAATGERLIEKLTARLPSDATIPAGVVARWVSEDLHPALPQARDLENAVIAGLSGPSERALTAPRVTWEGQQYRLDFAAAERNRLKRVREKQSAPRIDLPLQIADATRLLGSDKVTIDDLQDAASQFNAVAADLPDRSREEEADNVPAGVAPPISYRDALRKAADELAKAAKNKDVKRGARIAEPLVEVADDLLARNLLSFAYAVSLGDPEGTILLADDVSHRHDFGFGLKDADVRARVSWSMPRQEVTPGVPWHVTGSLLGLDSALATLALRRIATDRVLEAPKLTTNARDTFASSVSLMDPLALTDADRDAIANAIARGGQRVRQVKDIAGLAALETELGISGGRRRMLRWTLTHDPDRFQTMLTLSELLVLGGGHTSELNAWGMAVLAANGCMCSRMNPPNALGLLAGRPQLGLSASTMPDLNLRIAVLLKELGLPAPLARVVLSAAVQDFIDDARPTDDGDWLALTRAARSVTRERVEDYIAAATATGPLMPEGGRTPERVQ